MTIRPFYLRNTHQRRFKSSLKHQWWSFYSKIVNGFQSLSISTKEHHLRYQKKFVKQLLPASAVLQSYSWSSVKEKSATKSIRGKEKQHFRFSIAQRRSFHKADTQTKSAGVKQIFWTNSSFIKQSKQVFSFPFTARDRLQISLNHRFSYQTIMSWRSFMKNILSAIH